MEPSEQMLVEWECAKLNNAFSFHMDRRNYQEVASLFTDDAIFDRVGQVLKGRAAILEALKLRDPDLRTRHLSTNFHFLRVEAAQAEALVYNVTYVGTGDLPGAASEYQTSSGVFVEFKDSYALQDGRWRIAERHAAIALKPSGM